jgi:hypothetical protein
VRPQVRINLAAQAEAATLVLNKERDERRQVRD